MPWDLLQECFQMVQFTSFMLHELKLKILVAIISTTTIFFRLKHNIPFSSRTSRYYYYYILLLLLLLYNRIQHYDDSSKFERPGQCLYINCFESFEAVCPHQLGFQKSLKIFIWHCPKMCGTFRCDAKLQRIPFYDSFRSAWQEIILGNS